MKILNIGCGNRKIKNAVNVDINPDFKPNIIWDLNKKWTFSKTNEFDVVIANHIIEHLDDYSFIFSEIHRVAKNNAKVFIRVPHFSSVQAYSTFGHKHFFASGVFRQIPGFKLIKIQLNYIISNVNQPIWKRIISFLPSFLANLNLYLCERFWCYLIGGFSEIYIELEVIK